MKDVVALSTEIFDGSTWLFDTTPRAHLLREQLQMLEHLAIRGRTSVSDILTRQLDAVASAYADELSSISGFRGALPWPYTDRAELPPC